jgi:hypothetical protein
MLDVECKYVGRELEDYLLQSTHELQEKLGVLRERTNIAEEELQLKLAALADREHLALRCMLARDIWHMAMLYLTFLGSAPQPQAAVGATTKAKLDASVTPPPILPFKDTLFE